MAQSSPKSSLGLRARLARLTPARKLAAIGTVVGGAFLAGIGGYLATRASRAIEEHTAGSPGPPLAVRVIPDSAYHPASALDHYYILPPGGPTLADAAAAARDSAPWSEWTRRYSAVAGSPQFVRLELRALGKEPVVIHGVQVRIVRRLAPLRGWFVADGSCGVEHIRLVAVDLDATPPRMQYYENDAAEPKPQLTLSVTDSDVEVLELHVETRSSTVEWTAEVLYSGPDGAGRVVVDDAGRPFRVSSEVGSRGYRRFNDEFERVPEWDDGIEVC